MHMVDDFSIIKNKLCVETVITGESKLTMKGKHLEHCPLCNGKECFSIQKDKSAWKCFQCDKGGDLFTFLELFHGLDKRGALEKAAQLANHPLQTKEARKIRLSVTDKVRIEAAGYYHQNMLENGGRVYLTEKRGHKPEVLERMQVGWSDGRLLDHLRGKGFDDKEIIEAGLAKEREIEGEAGTRVVDFFGRGFAIFPHFAGGRVLTFTMKDPEKKYAFQLPADKRAKNWLFYNQDALERHQEIILVEGENDLLQVMNAGMANVIAMIGNLSDEQIRGLARHCRGKHLWLWVDNDEAGRKYVRRICAALREHTVRVITFGEADDDPDSYLRGFEGNRKNEIRRLQTEALDYISWEIFEASGVPSLEAKLAALKEHKVFQLVARQPIIQQQIYMEKLQELGFSQKAVEQQLDFSQDLYREICEYFTMLENVKDADPIVLGEIIFKFFANHGRFYFDRENTVYLIYQNKTYTVDNNVAFNALMLQSTRMIYSKAPGTQVWDALKHTAFLNGRRIDMCQWIHTDTVKDAVYLNLNSPNNVILKVTKERIEEIQNGMNDDHVLLSSSHKISPFNFLPDTDIQEGMAALKELLLDSLTCEPKQRFFILCWLMSGLIPDFSPYQGLMKFSGYASSGKSTAAKLFTTLFYGSEQLADPTGAAAFSSAAQNPILVIDNLEHKDLSRPMQKFLLLAATRGQKEKRTAGTDSGTTEESPRALVCITAIEPFTLPELISRTYDIPFDRRIHGSEDFYESQVLEDLKKKRDLIMSAIIKFIQKDVMPALDKRKTKIGVLNEHFKGHAKDRTNAYLALLMVILEKLLKYVPYIDENDVRFGHETGEQEIYTAWIEEQNKAAKETEIGSNTILQLLDGLVRDHIQLVAKNNLSPTDIAGYDEPVFVMEHPEYGGLQMIKTKPTQAQDTKTGEFYQRTTVEFVATAAEVVDAFDRYCKLTGKRNTYETAAIFSARLRNDMALLKRGGWELVTKEGIEPYYRVVSGKRFFKFRNVLVR